MAREAQSFLQWQGTAFNLVVEVLALDELHGKEGPAALLADFINGTNVGMTESGGSRSFPFEALAGLFVFEQMRRQKLQRDRALQLRVFGFVDDTHAALAELPGDLVVRNGPADHRRLNCTASMDSWCQGDFAIGIGQAGLLVPDRKPC